MLFGDRNGGIYPVIPSGNNSIAKNTFDIDDLMAPVVAELIKKGYNTKNCCQGHTAFNAICNFEECWDDPDVEYQSISEFSISKPYLMFDDSIAVPLKDLPIAYWKWEINTPASGKINETFLVEMEDGSIKQFYSDMDDGGVLKQYRSKIIPVNENLTQYRNSPNGFNLVIRPNNEYFGFTNEEMYRCYHENPYKYFAIASRACEALWKWAKTMPYADLSSMVKNWEV